LVTKNQGKQDRPKKKKGIEFRISFYFYFLIHYPENSHIKG
jgi:hypothetical protein